MRYLLAGILTFSFLNLQAQIDREPLPDPDNSTIKVSTGKTLIGKVIELGTNKPIEAATVQLFAVKGPEGASADSLISVVLTKANGDFRFEHIGFDSVRVVVSSVGFSPATIASVFAPGNDQSTQRQDIGNVILPREAQQLQAVVVTAATPRMKLGIDKKVFDVAQSLTSKGGTAEDVLKTIPSVSVDIDGNVQLRSGTPIIYVDGRPTILTLDQIPSDNIDKIELITNPSAKFDASSGSGIINVILKKDKRRGMNGIVSLSGGTPQLFRGNANLNLRQGKLNFFVSGGYNTSESKSKGTSDRINKVNGVVNNYFNQQSVNERERNFKSVRGGMDFFMDNRNTLTFSQGYTQGNFDNNESQEQQFLDINEMPVRLGDRNSKGGFEFRRNSTQLLYTHKFPTEEEQLDVSMNVNYGKASNGTVIVNNYYLADGTPDGDPQRVENNGSNNNNQWTIKADYTKPIDENKKIEAGVRSFVNNYESHFGSYAVHNGNMTKLPLSNDYKYQQQVHAAYFTFTDRIGNFGYQLGLRGEYSHFEGTLLDSARHFGYTYPDKLKDIWDALFPSVFLSQKIGENSEIQVNYSRRVRRPDFWQLNPFIDINDPQNIQQGNPELHPQFRNSYELNFSNSYGNNNNLLLTLYYRNTQGDITRYSDTLTAEQYAKLNNSAVDPNAILNTFINANSSNNYGVEFTLQQNVADGLNVTPSFSMAYRKVNAKVNSLDLSNNGFNWQAKLQANYKIKPENEKSVFNNTSFQLDGRYRSPSVIPQGKRLENYTINLAVKKDLFKNNKGSITLGVNDLLNQNKNGTIYDTPSFYQESYSRWQVRTIRLSFSYKFGDANFQLFKRGNGDDEGGGFN
ncbi:MAG: TonB-dependent receptor [Chitinophagales bacterium]|nr:TonB-dependent receptor [Chitinophagales bacterium]